LEKVLMMTDMAKLNYAKALRAASEAARAAGDLLLKNWRSAKKMDAVMAHDIKLELDTRCQRLIEKMLRREFPEVTLYGEEGASGDPCAPYRWVVDPIDGTVNFAYAIPHACVSIALQGRTPASIPGRSEPQDYESLAGVVYEPFCNEIWTAIKGKSARLNGKIIKASIRNQLKECVISIGFAKYDESLRQMLPNFQQLVHRVRKIRIMGSAALDLVYVASGRFDAYLESGVRLWDIAAGGLILECAGGEFWHRLLPGKDYYHVVATNGLIRKEIEQLTQ
jgi:myo-inositol-1(or 4)-monophosphatase